MWASGPLQLGRVSCVAQAGCWKSVLLPRAERPCFRAVGDEIPILKLKTQGERSPSKPGHKLNHDSSGACREHRLLACQLREFETPLAPTRCYESDVIQTVASSGRTLLNSIVLTRRCPQHYDARPNPRLMHLNTTNPNPHP